MTVNCPNCGKGNNLLPNMKPGKNKKCASCGVPFVIPEPAQVVKPEEKPETKPETKPEEKKNEEFDGRGIPNDPARRKYWVW